MTPYITTRMPKDLSATELNAKQKEIISEMAGKGIKMADVAMSVHNHTGTLILIGSGLMK